MKSKFLPKANGPSKVLERINDKAYKLELPQILGLVPTANGPFKCKKGEDDEDVPSTDTAMPIQRPMNQ